MKFSFSWLKELSGYNGTAEKLAELLSAHAFETELASGTEFKNIIVAKVLKVEKHPNADRLRVVELTDGANTYAPVVCGAWNFEAGAVVPLALPGATIPHDQHDPEGKSFTLGKATIRGIESQGMICSGKELGLSDDGKGILVLSEKDYKLGQTFAPKEGEIYLDIAAPANRPDLLGYDGVSREIAVFANSKLAIKDPKINLEKFKPKVLRVNIASPKLCSRYIAVRLSGVEIAESPKFIQDRIRLSGRKPINNVVDITNYVMLETGQPLHAFDASKITGHISVRTAFVNEKLKTLDGQERHLSASNLVIADGKHAMALAGIIGGDSSKIDDFSSEIILEAANFDPVSIRKTAREFNLRTDAAVRFEKSLPQAMTDYAAAYAAELLVKYAKATVSETCIAGQKNPPLKKIQADPGKINALLGTKIDAAEQKKVLAKYGYKVQGSPEKFSVTVPFMRSDVSIWQDLAEDIGRFTGLDEIDNKPAAIIPSFEMTDTMVDFRQQAASILASLGYSEIYTYSFCSEKDLSAWGIDPKSVITVANPLSSDQEFMRPNILLSMMRAAEYNSRFAPSGDYFEIGNVYWKDGTHILEKTYLGIMSFDRDYPSARLVSAFKEFARRMNVPVAIDQDSEQLAVIKSGKEVLGRIGRVAAGELNWLGVNLDFEAFLKHVRPKTLAPIVKYPSVDLDVAVWARRDLPWSKIEQVVRSVDSSIIRDVRLFDVYTGKNAPGHKKSVAFRIVYQSDKKTLTDEEVQKVHLQVIKELKARLNLEVRD